MGFMRISAAPSLALLLIFTVSPARSVERDVYPAPDQAKPELAAALDAAATTHKRVILDFGGNWCADCHVLDHYFHDTANAPILQANYILVHINIGRMTDNLDIAER